MKMLSFMKYLFSVLGFVSLVGAVMTYKSTNNFLSDAVSAQGAVVGFEEDRGSGLGVYHPIVEFMDSDGRIVVFTSSVGRSPAGYLVGDAVEVLYQPANVQDAIINDFFDVWGMVITMGIVVGALLSGGLFIAMIIQYKHRRRNAW
jgi:hypothetical protein